MPVILDRLPLPNISWYTGISVLFLLCSVYYAGVQVKLHPDWKEQLEQRHNARLGYNAAATQNYGGGDDSNGPLHWGVFNGDHIDNGGFCLPRDELAQNNDLSYWLQYMIQEAQQLCHRETFENILQATFYDEMCYIRMNSLDISFVNYKNHNYARLSHDKQPYSATEYTRRCQVTARRLSLKYNLTAKSRLINLGNTSDNPSTRSNSDNAKSSRNNDNINKSNSEDGTHATLVNSCTTDTFYDSYKRTPLDGEISLYHIPMPSRGCGDLEREMSPYLIPEIISFMFHEPLCIWVSRYSKL